MYFESNRGLNSKLNSGGNRTIVNFLKINDKKKKKKKKKERKNMIKKKKTGKRKAWKRYLICPKSQHQKDRDRSDSKYPLFKHCTINLFKTS